MRRVFAGRPAAPRSGTHVNYREREFACRGTRGALCPSPSLLARGPVPPAQPRGWREWSTRTAFTFFPSRTVGLRPPTRGSTRGSRVSPARRRCSDACAPFQDPYAAFFQTDVDRDGILSMQDLHRLLQRLLFNLKDAEFERLLGLLGLRLSVTLNFREFRNLLEKRPFRTDEAPQRLIR